LEVNAQYQKEDPICKGGHKHNAGHDSEDEKSHIDVKLHHVLVEDIKGKKYEI